MRKLFILTTFLSSLMMSSVAHAEWTLVVTDITNKASFYVDLERTRKHDGKLFYWNLANLAKPAKTGTTSLTIYTEAECGRFRYRNLNQTFYKGSMGSGTIAHTNNTPDKDWTYPSPNSVGEFKLKAVCNH